MNVKIGDQVRYFDPYGISKIVTVTDIIRETKTNEIVGLGFHHLGTVRTQLLKYFRPLENLNQDSVQTEKETTMNKTINPTVDILDCNGNSYGRVFSTRAALAAAKVMAQQYLVSLDVRTKEGQLLFTVEPVIHARVIWKSDEAPELSGINLKVKKDAAAK